MKKILLYISLLLGFTAITFTQQGQFIDKGDAYHWKWVTESRDSAETFTSGVIPAYAFMNLYGVSAVDTGEVDSDVRIMEYILKNAIVIVQVKGSGTVDSLSGLFAQGRTPSDGWATFDTVATAKETSCMTKLSYNNEPRYPEIRFTGTVADLTVSAYNVVTYIELIIPKLFR